jgi:hypothetical protein
MSGIERMVAAILLAGAVVGAALIPRFLAGPPGSSRVVLAPAGRGNLPIVRAAEAPPLRAAATALHGTAPAPAAGPTLGLGARIVVPTLPLRVAPAARRAAPRRHAVPPLRRTVRPVAKPAPAKSPPPPATPSPAPTPAPAPAPAAPAPAPPAPAPTAPAPAPVQPVAAPAPAPAQPAPSPPVAAPAPEPPRRRATGKERPTPARVDHPGGPPRLPLAVPEPLTEAQMTPAPAPATPEPAPTDPAPAPADVPPTPASPGSATPPPATPPPESIAGTKRPFEPRGRSSHGPDH